MRTRTKVTSGQPPAAHAMEPAGGAGLDLFTVALGGRAFAVISFPVPAPREPRPRLSPSEMDVARRAVAGASNLAIAQARRTSQRTVANQLASVFEKLGVRSRSALAAHAAWFAPALADDATARGPSAP